MLTSEEQRSESQHKHHSQKKKKKKKKKKMEGNKIQLLQKFPASYYMTRWKMSRGEVLKNMQCLPN